MYVSRRHSRRLLLPPGWVTLGFLLLLGCQIIIINKQWLQPKNVLQLTMPLLERIAEEKRRDGELDTYLFSKPLASIKTATSWQNASLVGKLLSDSVNEAKIKAAVLALQADEGHARGVRVHFGSSATYRNLASLLDMMLRLNQPRYWLDIEHQPTTFYIVNGRAVKTRKSPRTKLTYY